MSIASSLSEQTQDVVDEALASKLETSLENASLAWVPELGIAIIVVGLIVAGLFIWTNRRLSTRSKLARTLDAVLWALIFIILETVLALFASRELVVGSSPLFVLASIAPCFGGVSSLASQTRRLFEPGKAPGSHKAHSEDGSERRTSRIASAFDDHRFRRVLTAIVSWLLPLLAIAGVSALCFVFLEMPSNASFLYIDSVFMTCELTVIASVVAGCWLIFQRRPIGFIVAMVASAVCGITEYYVESFKSAAIMPSDLRSIGTGVNVASGYECEINGIILLIIILFCFAAGAIAWLKDPLSRPLEQQARYVDESAQSKHLSRSAHKDAQRDHLMKNAVAAILSFGLGVALIAASTGAATDVDWKDESLEFDFWATNNSNDSYGLIPSFIAALQLEDLEAPADYSQRQAEELEEALAGLYDQYVESSPERQAAVSQFDQIKPNVILVMNESFADLSSLGGLGVGYEGLEHLNALDAIARGKTSVSVFGGSTCNPEFEALTGTSLGYVGGGINPFALFDLSTVDSLPKQFSAMGYETSGIHPELATNWRRGAIYPELGFDEFIDQESFADAVRFREYVRDYETYDVAIGKILESDEPQFIFDLTMMGHGWYKTGLVPEADSVYYDFEPTGIARSDNDVVNEYLSSVRMSDQDLQHLVDRLSGIEEPCVVVFFGDHQPGFANWFQAGFADDSSDIAYQESLYATDYFIWTNYPVAGSTWGADSEEDAGVAIEGEDVLVDDVAVESEGNADAGDETRGQVLYSGTITSADLMGWAMSFIGAPMNDFEKASYMSRWWIQANNIFGYMDAAGTWHPLSEADASVGAQTYDEGMKIIAEAAASGLPSPDELPDAARDQRDAVIVNVMRWISYLNFAEKLK